MQSVVLLSGSPSATSRSSALLDYAAARLQAKGLQSVQFSVRDFPAEDLVLGRYESPAFAELHRRVGEAPALIVSTPVYKAAYAGGFKTMLDVLPQTALRGKTVLPLVTGGSPAHQLVIDYALKPVLSALGATDLLQGVYLVDGQYQLTADGTLSFLGDLQERVDRAVDQIVASVRGRAPASA
ncbi:MAG TPA: NADPH-dependent FMN reductase [Candidatus Synoicihabitans sp.]|nr:NADPH-dependent FMN reductase [Candidatus Synoicihabitans sp.]